MQRIWVGMRYKFLQLFKYYLILLYRFINSHLLFNDLKNMIEPPWNDLIFIIRGYIYGIHF